MHCGLCTLKAFWMTPLRHHCHQLITSTVSFVETRMHFLCLKSSVMHCSHSLQPDVKRRAQKKDFLFVYHWFSVLYLVLKDSVLTLSLLLCLIVFPLKSLTRKGDFLVPGITSVLFRLWSIYLKVYLFLLPLSAGYTWFINALHYSPLRLSVLLC